jgi:hypothetical protein
MQSHQCLIGNQDTLSTDLSFAFVYLSGVERVYPVQALEPPFAVEFPNTSGMKKQSPDKTSGNCSEPVKLAPAGGLTRISRSDWLTSCSAFDGICSTWRSRAGEQLNDRNTTPAA